MVLFLMENIHDNDPHVSLTILTPRNEALFSELAQKYPYLRVVSANRRTAIGTLLRLARFRNCVITPPTPGRLPFATKAAARLVALRGRLVGFDDRSILNRIMYTQLLAFDHAKSYCDALLEILPLLGFRRMRERPMLAFERTPHIFKKYDLTPGAYVVLHPFGSAAVRSIVGRELRELIEYLRRLAPDLTIVLNGNSADRAKLPPGLGAGVKVIAGEVSMRELATLLQDSKLYVGVDTGITHLACVLGVRSLVIAHEGAANWLPYYNPNATIIYKVRGDSSGTHEGRTYLESHRKGAERYLERVPEAVIKRYLEALFSKPASNA
jgi:ADP-heptose:LPS heptosyltransferase